MTALLNIKIAPPRMRRWLIVRERLIRKFQSVRECALLCVQAPAGYGKTSLLTKLRREWLAAGACAAWLSIDEHDTAERFVEGLLLAAYTALGRPAPASATAQAMRSGSEPRAVAASLLGELANEALPIALVLDDVHALPDEVAADLLRYIAFNLPPNVHLIVGTRRPRFPRRGSSHMRSSLIKNPKAPMPKLYPSPLTDTDVTSVAQLVETLN